MTLIAGIDIESTGLYQADGDRIVEIAMIFHDLDTHKEVGRFEARINPERGIDPGAQAVHGISYEDLIGKPKWEEVAPKVSALLKRCRYLVAHNGVGFDYPFIWAELKRAGAPVPEEIGVIDTMLDGRWATPDGAIPNLGALCWACEVDYDKSKAHAATYDVEVMMACFFKMLPKGFFRLPEAPYVFKAPKGKEKRK